MPKQKQKTINVIPSKHIYDALIQDIDKNRAISDLIDNALDNWKIQKCEKHLEINISVKKNKIIIIDNSGGLDLETLPFILMPGGTNRGGGEGIRGIWGVGSKRALFSLGGIFTIKTRKENKNGLILEVNEDWFNEDIGDDKWEIGYQEDNSIEIGTTTLIIEKLKVILNKYSIAELRKYIARVYADELQEGYLSIVYNNEPIIIILDIPWAKSDYAPPSRYITDIPVPNTDRKIHVEITLGIMRQPGEEYTYGIDFIGNGRTILQNNLDWRMGFEKNRLGLPHPTINRFKAQVRVKGDSRDIPWNSAKSDINPNHPTYVSIVDTVYLISSQYTSFLRKNWGVTSTLFKTQAKETDIKDIIFKYGENFNTVVKEYHEPKKIVYIPRFAVPEQDFKDLVNYFGLHGKTKTNIGLFIFNRSLKEVRGIVED